VNYWAIGSRFLFILVDDQSRKRVTAGSLFYYANFMRPHWAATFRGQHSFVYEVVSKKHLVEFLKLKDIVRIFKPRVSITICKSPKVDMLLSLCSRLMCHVTSPKSLCNDGQFPVSVNCLSLSPVNVFLLTHSIDKGCLFSMSFLFLHF